MNTQGWIRGMMSNSYTTEKFVDHVMDYIAREFEVEFYIINNENSYLLCIDNYKIEISKKDCTDLQKKSPYSLDKYILESLAKQGFNFDHNRSQYIEYCYGIVNTNKSEKLDSDMPLTAAEIKKLRDILNGIEL